MPGEGKEKRWAYVMERGAGFDRGFFYFDPSKAKKIELTLYLGRISASFKLGFDNMPEAVEFLDGLNTFNFSNNDHAMFEMLAYGKR